MIIRYKYINEKENHKRIDRQIKILQIIIIIQVLVIIGIICLGVFGPPPQPPENPYITNYGGN